MSTPEDNNITAYLHCGLCLKEIPQGISPKDWAQISVGWTRAGLQAWCIRHEVNILHVDFEGVQHPATTNRRKSDDESDQNEISA